MSGEEIHIDKKGKSPRAKVQQRLEKRWTNLIQHSQQLVDVSVEEIRVARDLWREWWRQTDNPEIGGRTRAATALWLETKDSIKEGRITEKVEEVGDLWGITRVPLYSFIEEMQEIKEEHE